MTTKLRRHHDLAAFQADFAAGRVETTGVADAGMADLGMTRQERAKLIASMTQAQFYKSMTAYENPRQWQDVYHVPASETEVYVKFTNGRLAAFCLLSFKEK